MFCFLTKKSNNNGQQQHNSVGVTGDKLREGVSTDNVQGVRKGGDALSGGTEGGRPDRRLGPGMVQGFQHVGYAGYAPF